MITTGSNFIVNKFFVDFYEDLARPLYILLASAFFLPCMVLYGVNFYDCKIFNQNTLHCEEIKSNVETWKWINNQGDSELAQF